MSEYVRKQDLLDRINTIRNAHIEKRNEGDECDQFANEAVADWLWAIQDEIQSGAFDAEPDGEVQRLKVALATAKGWIKYLVYIGQNIEPEMEKKAFDEIEGAGRTDR